MTDSPTNGRPAQGAPYRFEVIKLSHMMVDAYQRPLTTFVKRIEDNYNPALIGTLVVSERSKTKYALIDGQTRAEGMKRVGEVEAPCIVFEKLTLAEEARLFARFQTERRGMTSADRFKAEVIAKDPDALAINAVIKDRGFFIDATSKEPGAIRAIAALEFVFHQTFGSRGTNKNRDSDLLADTLDTLREAWPKLPDTAKSAAMIRGLGWYLARDPDGTRRTTDIDMDRLVDRLAKVTPSDLAKRAEALREGRGMGGQSPAYMAEAIEAQYRKR
jgi:hypothetical protein